MHAAARDAGPSHLQETGRTQAQMPVDGCRRQGTGYQREYDALATEHEKLSEKIRSIEEQKKDKSDRRRRIEVFLRMVEDQEECVRFDPYNFVALVDRVVVGQAGKLEFFFRNGMKYENNTKKHAVF